MVISGVSHGVMYMTIYWGCPNGLHHIKQCQGSLGWTMYQLTYAFLIYRVIQLFKLFTF
jgi:hypothetical protein